MKFLVTFELDVYFDTDGEEVVEFNIPAIKDAIEAEFEGTIHNAIDESLVEEISDASGWAVKSLNISEIKVIGGF